MINGEQITWAIGDIHGALPRLKELLQEAKIIDRRENWSAGKSTGVTIGDYVNRGEQGAATISYLQKIQSQARSAGGIIIPLLGNHDVLMCGVLSERQKQPYGQIASRWLMNGGKFLDLEQLEKDPQSQSWLRALPAIALTNDTLYIHCDSLVYLELGASIDEVNEKVHNILMSHDLDRIVNLFDLLCRRRELRDLTAIERMLSQFGGSRIVHGHTPIFSSQPQISHEGRCIDIDGAFWDEDEGASLGFVFTG
jgi:hypothetical protein